MAIGFATSIDDMLAFFLVSNQHREKYEGIIESALVKHGEEAIQRNIGINRGVGCCLASILVSLVLRCEDLMKILGGNEAHDFAGVPCSDIVNVMGGAGTFLVYLCCLEPFTAVT